MNTTIIKTEKIPFLEGKMITCANGETFFLTQKQCEKYPVFAGTMVRYAVKYGKLRCLMLNHREVEKDKDSPFADFSEFKSFLSLPLALRHIVVYIKSKKQDTVQQDKKIVWLCHKALWLHTENPELFMKKPLNEQKKILGMEMLNDKEFNSMLGRIVQLQKVL